MTSQTAKLSHPGPFSQAKRSFFLLLIFGALGGAFGLCAALLMEPVYRAEVVVSVVGINAHSDRTAGILQQFEGIAGLAGIGVNSTDELHAVAILKSKRFTEEFIARHRLLPILFPEYWDESSDRWIVDDNDVPTLTDGRKLFEQSLRYVDQDPASGLTRLYIEWHDPEQATAWANMMIEDVNTLIRSEVIRDAERSIAYLQKRLETTTLVDIKQAIFPILEQEMKKITFANIRDEYALKVIDPALVPARDDPVHPNLFMMTTLGLLLGLLLGMTAVVVSHRVRLAGDEKGVPGLR